MRILVIEDNRDIAANLGDYLEERGHTVDFAADGVTGLHLAVVNNFDAIVLDLNLPGMDGLEVCRKLRNEGRKQTPVLMLTARDSPRQQAVRFRFRRRRLPGQAIRAAGSRSATGRARPSRQGRAAARAASGRPRIQPRHARSAPRRQAAAAQSDRAEDPAVADGSFAGGGAAQELETRVWGEELPDSDSLRVHIHGLRAAVDKPFDKALIQTRHGIGYRIADSEPV